MRCAASLHPNVKDKLPAFSLSTKPHYLGASAALNSTAASLNCKTIKDITNITANKINANTNNTKKHADKQKTKQITITK